MPDKNLWAVIQLVKTNKRSLTRPAVPLGKECGLISRTAACNRAYYIQWNPDFSNLQGKEKLVPKSVSLRNQVGNFIDKGKQLWFKFSGGSNNWGFEKSGFHWRNRLRFCTAAMLHGRNNRFFFLWEKFFFLMQIIFIVSAMQLGCCAKPLENYVLYIS